jgi:hypothetical protein
VQAGQATFLAAFRRGLRERGYVEGQKIVLENRFAGEVYERFDALAAELANLKVDVLVASSTPAALAAKRTKGHISLSQNWYGRCDPFSTRLSIRLTPRTGHPRLKRRCRNEFCGSYQMESLIH